MKVSYYYIEIKQTEDNAGKIHLSTCEEVKNKMQLLYLGSFSSFKICVDCAKLHFPEWKFKGCICCIEGTKNDYV